MGNIFIEPVSKSSIVVITIEGILEGHSRSIKIRPATVDQIDVHPAIVVIIEEGATAPDSLRQVSLRGAGIIMNPFDTASAGRYLLESNGGTATTTAALRVNFLCREVQQQREAQYDGR